ncbi:unnamed protein product [Meloidogyne enterolobii]|uniref:Uncharacterized protein n=1 Tax=Meloidogyne enterolobii TaxID=390850 RepID=A0ACB1A5A5_MELEN
MSHNYCRSTSLNLYEYNKQISNATFHIFFNATEWKFGPWCYVNKEVILPFLICVFSVTEIYN